MTLISLHESSSWVERSLLSAYSGRGVKVCVVGWRGGRGGVSQLHCHSNLCGVAVTVVVFL